MMRIDNFAGLNARYGRDHHLRRAPQRGAVPQCLSPRDGPGQRIRRSDLRDAPARRSSTELIRVADRLRQAVARCVLPIGGQSVQFTVSLAAAVAIQTDSTEQMLARVEEALEQATSTGGNCTFFHTGQQPEPAQATLERIRTAAAV